MLYPPHLFTNIQNNDCLCVIHPFNLCNLLLNGLSLTEVRTIFIIYIMYILFCACVVFI